MLKRLMTMACVPMLLAGCASRQRACDYPRPVYYVATASRPCNAAASYAATALPAMPVTAQPAAGTAGTKRHTVKAGETMWSISRMYNIDLDTLARANSIVDNRSIARGQVLTIPAQALQPGAAAVPSAGPAVNASFAWPARGQVLSRFGDQVDTGTNKGIDISAKEGSRVTASMDGKVVYCDPQFKGFGQTVILDHAGGYQTVYSYNSEILVRTGEQVRQGQTIARAGQSGRASRPMLHFEIRRDGQPQNPSRYLAE